MLLRKPEAGIYSWEQSGFCHISIRQFLVMLVSYIMRGKEVIIKIDINETCILENS